MKILAIIDVAAGAQIEKIRAEIASEVRESWNLFVSGALREAYATAAPSRVVFVFEAATPEDAAGCLDEMPLIKAGHLKYELIELRPFTNWSLLFAKATRG